MILKIPAGGIGDQLKKILGNCCGFLGDFIDIYAAGGGLEGPSSVRYV